MSETQTQARKLRRLVWLGGLVSLVTVAIAIFASWLLYQQTINLLTQNLRERLLSISITEAANISASDVNALQVESDWKKPQWAQVVDKLHAAKAANKDIVYMYIFRKEAADPTKMEYVADAGSINPYANTENDPSGEIIDAKTCPKCVDANNDGAIDPAGADNLQWPGQEYVDPPSETFNAYNGPTTVHDLYSDAYGSVLTGYAPIYNSDGTVAAILATDIRADDFFTITRQTLYPFLLFISFLILIITVLAVTLIVLWERRAEALATLDQMKNEFLSIASHQLRAPITAIRGYAANILEGSYGPVPENLNEPLAVIQESTRLMANSIEDYLNISRIEQGRMKYEKSDFDLVKLAGQVVNELGPLAKKRKLNFTLQAVGPIMVNADIGKMKQVLTNLADNSIKYTESGSVTVIVDRAGGRARVTVSDTGIGIAKDEIDHLFTKFTRARGANAVNTTGTGLGLYVAKQLAEGNGGSIHAESDGRNKGSRFIIELPAKA
jgi:signal transduction histidine kinase